MLIFWHFSVSQREKRFAKSFPKVAAISRAQQDFHVDTRVNWRVTPMIQDMRSTNAEKCVEGNDARVT